MLIGRKFLSPETRKSSPRVAVKVLPLGLRMFCLIEQPWIEPKMTLLRKRSGMWGTSSETSPACAQPLSLWNVWSQISFRRPYTYGL